MLEVLPRAQYADNVRIDVDMRVALENVVGGDLSPADQLLQKLVRRNPAIEDTLLRCVEMHRLLLPLVDRGCSQQHKVWQESILMRRIDQVEVVGPLTFHAVCRWQRHLLDAAK